MHKYPLSNVLVSDYSYENNTVHDITKIKIKERFSPWCYNLTGHNLQLQAQYEQRKTANGAIICP